MILSIYYDYENIMLSCLSTLKYNLYQITYVLFEFP